MSRRPSLAISLGDPCGIGPELLLGSLPAIQAWADVTVVGSRAGADLLEQLPGAPVSWRWVEPPAPPPAAFTGRAYGLQVSAPGGPPGGGLGSALWLDPTPDIGARQLCLGKGSAASGEATVQAIRIAALLTLSGATDALVTLPMAKSAAHQAGYPLPGHTEFLQELAGAPITRMAFLSPRLNVVLHTVHQSLRSVLEGLNAGAVAETLAFSAREFQKLSGQQGPRVALCALNPHAGEQGAFGGEERLLDEALSRARAAFDQEAPSAPVFSGPWPSDSVFQRAARGEFDLVVALYHDQGLIPVKLLEPTRAVNVTLGLPFVRTSPDHGTAFDKAGHWIADRENFMEAAALAARLAGGTRPCPSPGTRA
jgi:4-hydroxythreonine-4-phosphate dehydrogenase